MRNFTQKSKTPKKLATKRALVPSKRPAPQPTVNRSSSNSSSSSTSIDFLSRPVTGNTSSSSSEDEHFDQSRTPDRRQTFRPRINSLNQRSSIGSRVGKSSTPNATHYHDSPRRSQVVPNTSTRTTKKTPRKQSKPKRRRDHVLRQIRMLKNTVNNLIPLAPFQRVVREIMQDERSFGSHEDWRCTKQALLALQDSAESFIVQLLEDSYLCSYHRGRVTLTIRDMILARMLRRDPLIV